MDMITIRRKLMSKMQSGGIDTSPRISEYGVFWNRTFGSKTTNADWCITEWYDFDPQILGAIHVFGYIGSDNGGITFQHSGIKTDETVYRDWYYFSGVTNRTIGLNNATLIQISFSIETAKRNDAYAYIQETGQILFAGRNTPYYGYTNINDMPTGT